MKQPEDVFTVDWCGETGKGGGMAESWFGGPGAERRKRGAYAGAVKLGSENMRCRARTGKSQAEFAALCGISERTLRTWEASGNVSTRIGIAIVAKLRELGAYPGPHKQPIKYRCDMTGSTWSGRGQMPVWLQVTLRRTGRPLTDFQAR